MKSIGNQYSHDFRSHSIRAAFLGFCLLAAILPATAQVQTVTQIGGTVTDRQGAVISGVEVTLTNENTGATQKTTTDATGSYSFLSILPGTYSVRATSSGFKSTDIVHRIAQVGQPAIVDFRLQVGGVNETVTVSAVGADLIDTTTAEVTGTIPQQLVSSLPLNGRNFLDLVSQVPGTSSTGAMGLWRPNGSAQVSFTQSALMGVQVAGLSVAGGVFLGGNRDSASNISIDGSNVQMAIYGQVTQLQSPSSIEEVKVESGVMNAEFGFGTGAVNTITKSGTKQFHGELYEYLRNTALDANDYFLNLAGRKTPTYQMNQFGGSAGGPIIKNNLHFFANYEELRVHQANINTANTAPAALRNGDFSAPWTTDANGNPVAPPTIYNPYQYDPTTGLRTPFPNNMIPMGPTNLCSPRPTCVDPVTVAYLKYSPLPNTSINGVPTYVSTTPSIVTQRQYTGRIDWDLSEKTRIFGRYTHFDDKAFQTNVAPIAGISNPFGTINPTVSWAQTISPTVVNNLTISLSRSHFANSRALDGFGNIAADLGLQNTSNNPGGPDMNVAGIRVVGSNYSLSADLEDNIQLKEDLSLARGKHTFKFGFQANNRQAHFDSNSGDKGQLYYQNVFSAACPQGNSTCAAAQQASGLDAGGMGFADYLLGTNIQAQLILPGARYNASQSYYGAYAQDTWRITPKLTANVGLRYDYWTPWLNVNRMAVHWDANSANVVFSLKNPLDYLDPQKGYGKNAPLNPGVPAAGYTTGKKNFAPRGGLAYQLAPNTTLRAGAGIYFDGNPNLNQFSYVQSHAGPFGLLVNNTIGTNQQLPTIFTDQQFPAPAATAIAAPSATNPISIGALQSDYYPTPTVYQWTASVQQRLGGAWALEVSYLGTHTIREMQFVDLNPPNAPLGSLAGLTLQQRRLSPDWASVITWGNIGFARYNLLLASIKTPRWHGLTLTSWFGYSHDSASSQLGQSDIGNTDFRYAGIWAGPSLLNPDVRQVNTWNYELPIGRGKMLQPNKVLDWIVGNWTVSGTAEFSQGGHQEAFLNSDNTGTGQAYPVPDRVPNCDPNSPPGGRTRLHWFNTACFATPTFGKFGNAGIGSFVMPGINNFNLSVQKNFNIIPKLETQRLQFRADFFNAFNHTQWGFVNNQLGNSNSGQVASTHPARQIQVALKYMF